MRNRTQQSARNIIGSSSYSYLCLAFIVVAFAGCNFTGIAGSGFSVTEEREVSDFTKISLRSVGELNVVVGPEKSVIVTIDDNLQEIVQTEVVGGELKIHTTRNFRTKVGLKIEVTVPDLAGINVSGAADANVSDVNGDAFDVHISGAGEATVAGVVKKLNVRVSGAGEAKLKELKSKVADVHVSGAGDIDVFVSESIVARVSGAGDVSVWGNPNNVDDQCSGAGEVTIKK